MENQPLTPTAVNDIQAWVLYEKPEGDLCCVGSLERDKYIAVPASKVPLILNCVGLLDGNHTLEMVEANLEKNYGQKADVFQLYQLLSGANLIELPAPVQVFQGEFRRFSVDLIIFNTRHFFERLQPGAKRSLKPLFLFGLFVIVLGIISLNSQVISIQNIFLVGDSFLMGYFVLALGSFFSIFCHELAHAFVAAAYGATARTIRVALYMGFIPYFYTEIAGLYTLKPAQRINIWLAGSYANLFLGCLGMLIYRWMGPAAMPPEVGQILTKFSLANLFIILSNLSPLMPTDGYFIVSTLLKKINIRTNALFEFLKWVRGEKNQLRGWILVYFLLTGTLILVMFGVQFRWIAGILNELFAGQLSTKSLQAQIFFIVFIALALLRVVGVFFFKYFKTPGQQ
jgi:putative peptide zinc metalloprotease protein